MQIQRQEQAKPKRKVLYKVLWAAAAVIAAGVLFAAGYFTYYWTMDGGLRSLLWFKEMIDEQYYEDIADEDFWQAAIDGAEGLLDSYSVYYTPAEFEQVQMSSQGVGIGVGLSFFSGTNKVAQVAINSPAFFAGVRVGMYVTGIGAAGGEIKDAFASVGGSILYYASTALTSLEEGTTVSLRLSADSPTATEGCTVVSVTAEEFTESYVLYACGGHAYAALHDDASGEYVWTDVSEYVAEDEQVTGAAYLRLSRFYGNAAGEFALALEQYRKDGADTLLLDLRNDGGGSVAVMQSIASYLLKDADADDEVVMEAVYGNGRRERYLAGGNFYDEYLADSEIYVAANVNTASASEALIGAMISYGTIGYADIFITDTVGQGSARTYGKGIMQTTYYNVATGEAAKLTTAQIYWPNGESIHGTGITTAMGARPSPAKSFGEYGDPELTAILAAIASEGGADTLSLL